MQLNLCFEATEHAYQYNYIAKPERTFFRSYLIFQNIFTKHLFFLSNREKCLNQLNKIIFVILRNLQMEYDTLSSKNARKWSIKRNKRQNEVKIDYVTIQGHCCWRSCDHNGNCDNFGLNEEKQPRFSFVKKIRAFEC